MSIRYKLREIDSIDLYDVGGHGRPNLVELRLECGHRTVVLDRGRSLDVGVSKARCYECAGMPNAHPQQVAFGYASHGYTSVDIARFLSALADEEMPF